MSSIYLAISGCTPNAASPAGSQADEKSFDYSQQVDDFSGVITSNATGFVWIDQNQGSFIGLGIECIRDLRDKDSSSLKLTASSNVAEGKNDLDIENISALLYKIDSGEPFVYHPDYEMSLGARNIVVGLPELVDFSAQPRPKLLQLRFVFGAGPTVSGNRTIQDFSQYPSVDAIVTIQEGNTGKVISDCVR